MDVVEKFGYMSIGVSNLDEAIAFYARFGRLDLTERLGDTAFMTGGPEHHWLRLEEGSRQGVKRLGYELSSEAAFDEVRANLEAWKIDYVEGGDPAKDRVRRWLRFTDPGGTDIELYSGMYTRGVAPVPNGVKLQKFLHGGWETTNWAETTRFYQEALGFKASDWIGERVGFFRAADQFHHSLVLIASNRSVFNHFCVQVESLDDVMRARNNAVKHGVKLRDDLLKHAPSGSIGVYLKDEERGYAVEFCTGHRQIVDADHTPRILPMTADTADVWLSPLPDNLPGDLRPREVDEIEAILDQHHQVHQGSVV
jgi:2,3-dihydroxy-p-cumate/2,3-dihydroxybenzoate 3,4-dioxygenase